MEPSRDIPWAEHEKVYLLAEIIKAAPVPSDVLFQFIRAHGIQPRWAEIALPQGRSLRQCQIAFQDILATHAVDPRAAGPMQQYYQPQPMYSPPVEISRKRPLAPEISTPTGRLLQPRPPNTYPPDVMAGPTYIMSPTMSEATNKKRRGRPTKAEAQARAAEAAARGEPYPPPRSVKRTSLQASGEPSGAVSPGPPAAGQIPVSMMMSTSTGSTVEVSSESESSKQRRVTPGAVQPVQEPGEGAGETASPTSAGAQQPSEGSRGTTFAQPSPVTLSTSTSGEQKEREPQPQPSDDYKQYTPTPRSFKDTVGI